MVQKLLRTNFFLLGIIGLLSLTVPATLERSGGGSGTHVTTTGEHPLVHEGIDVELDTSAFSGLLSATDTTVQSAFDTLDEAEAAFNSVFLRLDTTNDPMQGSLDFNNNDINDVNKICFDSDNDTCFIKSGGLLKVFVENVLQAQWPIAGVVVGDALLLELDDFVLLETGDKILLEI